MNNSRVRRRQQQTNFHKVCSDIPANFQCLKHSQIMKLELIQKLNQIIQNISNTKKIEVCTQDSIIMALQKVSQSAKIYDFKEIVNLANLAIGKRILNLQIERKKNQMHNKTQKKREIQSFFRQNRINKTNYEQIALQKLQKNTFIVRPHNDGKAFIQSTFLYQKILSSLTGKSYISQLQQCNYLQTIKTVNKIFFSNLSSISQIQKKKKAQNNPVLKIGAILCVIIAIMCIIQGSITSYILTYVIFGGNLVLLFLMVGLALYSFFHIKGGNNQLGQIIIQIDKYFEYINKRNKKLGLRHQWKCPSHFLYLQVEFNNAECIFKDR